MKALIYEEYAPDNDFERILKIKEIDEPKPKSNEVVFKVKATALNYDDIWGMRGRPIEIPMPHIYGTDAAGEVIAIGDDVKQIQIGDRVVSNGNLTCGVCKECTSGREFDCRQRKIWRVSCERGYIDLLPVAGETSLVADAREAIYRSDDTGRLQLKWK